MKKALIALVAVLVSAAAYGQGQVVFNTRVLGAVDAPVTGAPGLEGPGGGPAVGAMGQLYLVSGGNFTALTPATTFRSGVATREKYVDPVDVTIPGVAAGANATLRFRAWSGAATWEAASIRGESPDITIATGGGLNPPTNLVGLTGFTMVPEPSTIALGLLGAAALLFRRRK